MIDVLVLIGIMACVGELFRLWLMFVEKHIHDSEDPSIPREEDE
jgi:hypothetical protein